MRQNRIQDHFTDVNFHRADLRHESALNTASNVQKSFYSSNGAARHRGHANRQSTLFDEIQYEKVEGQEYVVVVKPPGKGFEHVLTAKQIEDRISCLPQPIQDHVLSKLAVVQLSSVKPYVSIVSLFGMQWGPSVYLYPMLKRNADGNFVDYYFSKPPVEDIIQARKFGGRFQEMPAVRGSVEWKVTWTPRAAANYFLDNILLHELGHLIDDRNHRYKDREAYANDFAAKYGHTDTHYTRQRIRKRHHKV